MLFICCLYVCCVEAVVCGNTFINAVGNLVVGDHCSVFHFGACLQRLDAGFVLVGVAAYGPHSAYVPLYAGEVVA